jgi:hypothetical protein
LSVGDEEGPKQQQTKGLAKDPASSRAADLQKAHFGRESLPSSREISMISQLAALLSPCAALSRPVLVTGPAFSEVTA